MLKISNTRRHEKCDGSSRRDFLQVGALGLGGLTLSDMLRNKTEAANAGISTTDKSIIWLWLSGGPTHVETFDPKMTAPAEYRSVTGEVKTNLPGVTLGGNFQRMAQVADKMAFVRSFAHTNSGHSGGTHYVMTGYDNRLADNGAVSSRPGIGSILSRVRGTNHPVTGMPTYVRLNGIYADGPAFLGTAYGPFDSGGEARRNMALNVARERLDSRRELLKGIDNLRRDIDSSDVMNGLDAFDQQAFDIILSRSQQAFDLKYEDPRVVSRYGKGLGEKLLQARRLCEAGCGFVTVNFGGWDMHGNIKQSMDRLGPQVDQAVAALVEDLSLRGQLDNTLLVVSGEFGRTPKINGGGGRDHWAPLSTLALAGGGLQMGQVIGESAEKVDVPKTSPIGPQDLLATIFHVMGINQRLQFVNQAGRPTYMVEQGKPIEALV
ncbi:hypothetical protein SV7mr_10100 [Stieleria bergensis]|uniref:DUF1501 domain-containing protein n=1 Tax=Stieleria bergensis TaxID=2528025 RepID=A0A517SQW8_9BACT|nr:MAG: hypothetical protein CBB71_14380 [Rhodopirellula sp. TMED11]QDT58517.1 hypothetical protein SV7mr_10100 [Planctomycetes bacterium SV_7m_r]